MKYSHNDYIDKNKKVEADETEFKIGDWVKCILEDEDIFQIDYIGKWLHDSRGERYNDEACELWKPQEGEWCVFWDDENEINTIYIVSKFEEVVDGLYRTNGQFSDECFDYENMAPLEFLQTLRNN